jgi:hypothetical protein
MLAVEPVQPLKAGYHIAISPSAYRLVGKPLYESLIAVSLARFAPFRA